MSLRILCIGSPQPGDELAWHVGEQLVANGLPTAVEVRWLDRPGAGLIEAMTGCAQVLLLDAAKGLAPGEVRAIHDQAALWVAGLSSTHGFGVAEALRLAAALGRLPQGLVILALGELDDQPGALQQMACQVEAWIAQAGG